MRRDGKRRNSREKFANKRTRRDLSKFGWSVSLGGEIWIALENSPLGKFSPNPPQLRTRRNLHIATHLLRAFPVWPGVPNGWKILIKLFENFQGILEILLGTVELKKSFCLEKIQRFVTNSKETFFRWAEFNSKLDKKISLCQKIFCLSHAVHAIHTEFSYLS